MSYLAPLRGIPKSPRTTKYFPLIGAIDLVTQEMQKSPGSAREAINFEPGIKDGFRRINGYEIKSGLAAPSAATWHVIELSDASDRSVGQTLTGTTSTASAEILLIEGNFVLLTDLSLNFQAAEATNGTGTVVAPEEQGGSIDGYRDTELKILAQNYYRDLIAGPAGAGSILGVWGHLGECYCFRNNVGNTAAIPFRATATGWVEIVTYHHMSFDTGTTAYAFGDAITSSGTGVGVVKRIIVNSGDWSTNDAKGFITLEVTAGTFADAETLGGIGVATATSAAAAVAFEPDGRFEFISENFFGGLDTYNVYGCDGVTDGAFELDSNYIITPILTGSVPDTPKYIRAHKEHLVLAIESTLVISRVGYPTDFDGAAGASTWAVGHEITGLAPQPGSVLSIASSRETYGLYGETVDDFKLDLVSRDSGAAHYSYQTLGDVYGFDDRGVTSQSRVQAYGNFEAATISQLIQPFVDQQKLKLVAASVLRKRNQIRFYFNDKTVLVIAINRNSRGLSARSTTLEYKHDVTCICNTEDEFGSERILFGSSDGNVYEAEKGFSFDGQSMPWFLRLNYMNPYRNIRQKFACYGVTFNIKSVSSFPMQFTHELSYSNPEKPAPLVRTKLVDGIGGFWDTGSYDEMFFDAQVVATASVGMAGDGTSVSKSLYNDLDSIESFELEGYTLDYSPRGMLRAYS